MEIHHCLVAGMFIEDMYLYENIFNFSSMFVDEFKQSQITPSCDLSLYELLIPTRVQTLVNPKLIFTKVAHNLSDFQRSI